MTESGGRVPLYPTPHEKGWRSTADEAWGRDPICLNCRDPWPCEVATVQAENERLREALRDLADAYRGIALNHSTVVTRHLPLIRAEEVLFGRKSHD